MIRAVSITPSHHLIHRASMLLSDCDPWSDELLLLTFSFFTFGLYSVMTTVTLFTVTSLVWAVLLSTFFKRGGCLRFLNIRLSFSLRFDTPNAACALFPAAPDAPRNWLFTCWATSAELSRALDFDFSKLHRLRASEKWSCLRSN